MAPAPAESPLPSSAGPDLLRRVLLVLVVGLVVAWPVVPAEDPGMLSEWAGPLGVVLTAAVLVAAVAWAVWHAWAGGEALLRVGLVDLALAVFVVLAFAGVPVAAGYKRAAWLNAWAWVGFACLCLVVRQLLPRVEDRQSLLAVLLAGAVALSANAVFHTLDEWPQDHAQLIEKPREFDDALSRFGTPTQEERAVAEGRVLGREESATYLHPAALAGLLVLLLPGLVGAAVASLRAGLPAWRTALTALCAGLAVVALGLTRQPLALAAVLAVGLVVVAVSARGAPPRIWGGALLALVLAGVGGYVLYRQGWLGVFPDETLLDRMSVGWRAAAGHPLLGIGAGQFPLFYPSLRAPAGAPRGVGPGNFVLQLAAEYGLPALLALFVALGVFLARLRKGEPRPGATAGVRWEFHAGGSLGILAGFLLRVAVIPETAADHGTLLLNEGLAAAIRAVVWFGAVALLERIPWSGEEFRTSLRAGVAGLLLFWLASDGVGWPSLVGVLWVVVGLGLAGSSEGWTSSRRELGRYLPLPVLGAVTLAYFLFVFYPVCNSAAAVARARTAGYVYRVDRVQPAAKQTVRRPDEYVEKDLVAPLRKAAREDPDNATLCLTLAEWYAQWWRIDPFHTKADERSKAAVELAARAGKINPLGAEGDLAEHQIRLVFASLFELVERRLLADADDRRSRLSPDDRLDRRNKAAQKRRQATEQRDLANEALTRAIDKDPGNLAMRYTLSELLTRAGDKDRAREQARTILRLDAEVSPAQRLTDGQREKMRALVGEAATGK